MAFFYPKKLVQLSAGRKRMFLAGKHSSNFSFPPPASTIDAIQLEQFNKVWEKAIQLPFYANFKSVYNLPSQISSISDLNSWPVLTKAMLREHKDLVAATPHIEGVYRTSGSTGQPFEFPRGKGEAEEIYANMWAYRHSHGLRPFDPFVLVSSTVAGAAQSKFKQARLRHQRMLKSFASNSWQTPGFIATPEAADSAITTIQILGPKYLIGYPSGIVNIARRAKQRSLHFPNLKLAILTSESISPVDIDLITNGLGIDVLVEYGAIETGVIAGTKRDGNSWPLNVHWWNNLITADPTGVLRITTLSKRIFPLINYALGDVIHPGEVSPSGSVLTIDYVEGRTRDTVTLPTREGGSKQLVARELAHLVRDLNGVISVQLTQLSPEHVEFYIVSESDDYHALIERMTSSIARNQRDLSPGTLTAKFVDSHIPSARGKRGVVIAPEAAPKDGDVFRIF